MYFSGKDSRTNQYNEEITRTKLNLPKSFKKIQIWIFQLPLYYINTQGNRRIKRQRQYWFFLSRTGGGICSPLLLLLYRASLLNLRSWVHGQMSKYGIQRKSQPEFYRVKSFFINLFKFFKDRNGEKNDPLNILSLNFPQTLAVSLAKGSWRS